MVASRNPQQPQSPMFPIPNVSNPQPKLCSGDTGLKYPLSPMTAIPTVLYPHDPVSPMPYCSKISLSFSYLHFRTLRIDNRAISEQKNTQMSIILKK